MAGERASERTFSPAGTSAFSLTRAPAAAWSIAAAALVVVSVIVRILLARRMPAPWIMSDELTYSELAKSFAASHRMLLHGHPQAFATIYPIFVSPAWLADSIPTAYGIAKTLNVLLMSLAAIPFWFWARRLMPPPHAFTALVLFLLLPAFVYTSVIMTENLAFPATLLALFVMALASRATDCVAPAAGPGGDRLRVPRSAPGDRVGRRPADRGPAQGAARCPGGRGSASVAGHPRRCPAVRMGAGRARHRGGRLSRAEGRGRRFAGGRSRRVRAHELGLHARGRRPLDRSPCGRAAVLGRTGARLRVHRPDGNGAGASRAERPRRSARSSPSPAALPRG